MLTFPSRHFVVLVLKLSKSLFLYFTTVLERVRADGNAGLAAVETRLVVEQVDPAISSSFLCSDSIFWIIWDDCSLD